MDRAKKKGNTAEPSDPCIREALVDMVDRTHPSHVISCMNDPETFINGVSDKLPPDWSVCVMSLVEKHKRFIFSLTRIRKGEPPFHIQTDGNAAKRAIDDHIAWYEDNISGMKTTDRVLWWTQRRNSHKTLLNIINHMEEKVLSINRGALLGKLCNQRHQQQLDKCVDAIVDLLKSINEKSAVETKFIEVYLASWQTFNEAEKVSAACSFFDQENISNFHLEALVLAFEKASATLQKSSQKRGHVILVLDKGLQMLPWETTPTLQPHSVSRVPSVHLLLWQLQLRGIPSSDQQDLSNASFVINPKGDLLNTASRFGDWFNSVQSWKGIVSRPPTQDEWLTSLSRNDVFIFCGHGAGGAYVQQEAIARRSARGVSFLIGCSSGRLTEPGITEPDGMVTWYMMSGCPSVMSCLWTVTDKDIDKHFATSLLTWARTGKNLTEIIRGCDKVCKHPLLNGAATVVYGLPVSCTNVPPDLTVNIPDIFKDLSPILS
uniref:separase n=1 Tax=Ciona savignyi TaxID=51511 RepID=H2YPY4_CIOSA